METVRLVLKEPFYKYPMGTVFELEDSNEFSGWDMDDRVRDRMPFSDKRIYHLPDSGRGISVSLSANLTQACPDAAFKDIDLRTGPCRVTKAQSGYGQDLQPTPTPPPCGTLREEKVTLVEIGGVHAQGLQIELPTFQKAPSKMHLKDCLRGEILASDSALLPLDINPEHNSLFIDCSALPPGFYQLLIGFPGDCWHSVQFVKSFPLRVEFSNAGKFSVHKTMY